MKIRTLAILLVLIMLPFAMPAAAQTPGLRGQGNSPRRGRQRIAGGVNPRKAGILSHRKPRRGGRRDGDARRECLCIFTLLPQAVQATLAASSSAISPMILFFYIIKPL